MRRRPGRVDDAAPSAPTLLSPRLLDELREAVRSRPYTLRPGQAYVSWARRFILFHGRRHPREMSGDEVERFLAHLATERDVAASTHQQALSALLFLYREVIGVELAWLGEFPRPK